MISPFTPLFFNPSTDICNTESRYLQTFANTDKIMVEVLANVYDSEPVLALYDECTGKKITYTWNIWNMNDFNILYYYVFEGLDNSIYKIIINNDISESFRVTDSKDLLSLTALIQYTMKDNRDRDDIVSLIDGKQYFFEFRVPGGFKDDDWAFSVDNEQFICNNDIIELYSTESTQKVFTLGNVEGCPIWYAEKLNKILSCSYVYFNNKRYARKDNSVPEINKVIDNVRSYVFKQTLQEVFSYNELNNSHRNISYRRIDDSIYRVSKDKIRRI